MEKYWIQKQDALLRRYFDAWPNQREFWFSNIVDELDEYQKHIESIRRKKTEAKNNTWM